MVDEQKQPENGHCVKCACDYFRVYSIADAVKDGKII